MSKLQKQDLISGRVAPEPALWSEGYFVSQTVQPGAQTVLCYFYLLENAGPFKARPSKLHAQLLSLSSNLLQHFLPEAKFHYLTASWEEEEEEWAINIPS